MHVLEHFAYHIRPYTKSTNLLFTGELVNSTNWDFTKVIKELPMSHDGYQGMHTPFNIFDK